MAEGDGQDALLRSGRRVVLACSALKASYRAVLGTANAQTRVVFLNASAALLEAR